MNRREFLGFCLASGLSIGFGGLLACKRTNVALAPADQARLSGLLIADAHAHPYRLHGTKNYDRSTPDAEMMQQVGMAASSFSAVGDMVKYGGRSGSPHGDTLGQLKKVKRLEEKKKVKLVLRAADIPSTAGSDAPPGAIMAIEGGDALEGRIENLKRFYEYGVRMITVLHDHDNEIGFNQRSWSDGPLTPFGVKVVEKMNALGMVVDVTHSRNKTLKSIVEVTSAPVVDSHTNPLPFGHEPSRPTRLRTWSEMEMVAKTGGIVCTWPLAYSRGSYPRTTLKDWAEEIVRIKYNLGIEHCGLGTDGGGNLPEKVKGWESILSLPDLVAAMGEAGPSRSDISAYLGGNFLRVLSQCLS